MANRTVFSEHKIKGKVINAPDNWQKLEVLCTFDNDSVQANIATTDLTFVLDGYDALQNHIESGVNGGVGITDWLPYQLD